MNTLVSSLIVGAGGGQNNVRPGRFRTGLVSSSWIHFWCLGFLGASVLLAAPGAWGASSAEALRSPKDRSTTPRSVSVPADSGSTNDAAAATTPSEPAGRGQKLRRLPPHAKRFNAREVAVAPVAGFNDPSVTNAVPKEWLKPPADPFIVGPGDVLDIELMGEPGRTRVLVCPDGKVYYHLLNGVEVWGLTLGQTRELIEKGMSEYQRVPKPRVSITVQAVGSKHIWLLGRIQAPGVYPLVTPLTLLEAVTMAGGPITSGDSDLASLQDSFVMRQGQVLPVNFQKLLRQGDMSQNIYLQPDDFVYLPSSFQQQVHLLGAVRQPGAVPFREEMTLVSAIAGAGGARPGAYLSHVAIVRGALTDPRVAIVDLGDIQKGRATDVLLEPRDIIFIPSSPYASVLGLVKSIVTTFVRTVAVNEGVRAVVRGASAVTPVVTQTQQ